jgi:SPP1 family predicted phage head-tail adaptor
MATQRAHVDAGDLDKRIDIEKYTESGEVDGRGHPIREWKSYLVDVACKIETPNAGKIEKTRQLVPTATHVVEIRYRELDVERHRLKYRGRIFNIGHQEDVEEQHVRLILTVTELKGATAQS